MKKVLSLLLCIVLLFGMLPVINTQAETDNATIETQETEVSVSGTNSVGNLLSNEIQQAQAESELAELEYSGGHSVVSLTFTDNVATVEYSSLEEANLIVALYSEDDMQLLASGNAVVSAEETVATVTIEGTMPQYFMASAYLVDIYDYSPLCPAYDTPMYTQEMQELLASTVEDYDQEKVLNLDDSSDTNFAVYTDSVVVIEGGDGVNTVVSTDYENNIYVIENADDQITSLTPGTIFAYPWAEEQVLIVKISAISVDGTTVTIIGAEMEIEEVFAYMKLETEGGMDSATVDDSTCDEGVTFEGIVEEGKPATRAWEGGVDVKKSFFFGVEKEFKNKGDTASVKVSGGLNLSAEASISFYISLKRQYVQLTFTPEIGLDVTVSGRLTAVDVALGEIKIPTAVPGIVLEGEPNLVLEFEVSVEVKASVSMTIGFGFDSDAGFQNLCTKPEANFDIELEGKAYFGLKLKLSAALLDDDIASLGIALESGIEISGKTELLEHIGKPKETDLEIHNCSYCIDMNFDFVQKLSVELIFLKYIKFERTFDEENYHLFKSYISLDPVSGGIGLGSCPNKAYRITINVIDGNGNPVSGAVIQTEKGEIWGTTNKNGIAITFIPVGTYKIYSTVNDIEEEYTITVREATKVTIAPNGKTAVSSNSGQLLDITEYLKNLDNIEKNDFVDFSNISNIAIGDVISLGNYNDQPIQWRCVDIDENGPLMLSVDVLCQKEFDAAGVNDQYHTDGWGYIRKNYGSNCWSDSSIRQWLNSSGKVEYTHCPPSYADEYGFMTYFTEQEKLLIKQVTQKTFINGYDAERAGYLSGGSRECYDIYDITQLAINYSIYYYQNTNDFFFLLNQKQLYNAFNNDPLYITSSVVCHTRIPGYYGASYENAYVMGNGSAISIVAANTVCGIRPAFYLNLNSNVAALNSESTSAEHKNAATRAIYPGQYETAVGDQYMFRTAEFADLVACEQYLLLALKSLDSENVLLPDNILFIQQKEANENGKLKFQYIQRTETPVAYVMACGPSHKNLNNATIIFPIMTESGDTNTVKPTVTYEGEILTENIDYVIIGDVDYTKEGAYSCYIRGIYNYTGLVPCTYTVLDKDMISAWNLTLGEKISMNFYMDIDEAIAESAIVNISLAGKTRSHSVSDAVIDEATGQYVFTVNLAAVQMTEMVTVELKNDDKVINPKSYSVRQYADYILDEANGYNKSVQALLREMLHYGAMAQVYFDYNTGNLANLGIAGAAVAEVPETAEKLAVTDKISSLNFYGASLVYRDRIAVRYYFTGDVTGKTFTANGNTYTPVEKDGMYYIEVADILPQDLDQQITLTVTDVNGNALSVAYGPMNYIVRMNVKGSDSLKNLVKALYNYHLAAKQLCENAA